MFQLSDSQSVRPVLVYDLYVYTHTQTHTNTHFVVSQRGRSEHESARVCLCVRVITPPHTHAHTYTHMTDIHMHVHVPQTRLVTVAAHHYSTVTAVHYRLRPLCQTHGSSTPIADAAPTRSTHTHTHTHSMSRILFARDLYQPIQMRLDSELVCGCLCSLYKQQTVIRNHYCVCVCVCVCHSRPLPIPCFPDNQTVICTQ